MFRFHMVVYGCHVILYDFHMVLCVVDLTSYGFHMILHGSPNKGGTTGVGFLLGLYRITF